MVKIAVSVALDQRRDPNHTASHRRRIGRFAGGVDDCSGCAARGFAREVRAELRAGHRSREIEPLDVIAVERGEQVVRDKMTKNHLDFERGMQKEFGDVVTNLKRASPEGQVEACKHILDGQKAEL